MPNSPIDRRSFLKNAALFAAGAYMAPLLTASNTVSAAIGSNIHIVETNLKFLALENRSFTDRIILHHVGDIDSDVSAATIHRWHLQNGWAGIGYHFVIRKSGKIERGRPLGAVGAHCWHYNETSLGINLVGNFEKKEPTRHQLDTVVRLIADLSRYYKLKPDAGTVFGHRDFNSTLCPGRHLYEKIAGLCASARRSL